MIALPQTSLLTAIVWATAEKADEPLPGHKARITLAVVLCRALVVFAAVPLLGVVVVLAAPAQAEVSPKNENACKYLTLG